MGRTLVEASALTDGVELVAALECPDSDAVGADAGALAGIGANGVIVADSIDGADFDVLIDFTTPSATVEHVEHCAGVNRRVVIGTTGLTDGQIQSVRNAASRIPVVYAPNMSVGVNVVFGLVKMAAKAFGDEVDVEVIESHHSRKVDAPSGTALKLGQVVADELGRSLDADGVFERHGQTGARKPGTIGFATIRAGDIVGEHTVMFAGQGERVEISHKSSSRMNYAKGSMRAAMWLMHQPPGMYDMQDVLGFA